MSDSETSSDIKVKYENANGENLLEDKHTKKNVSSDTDYYFNMIANQSKVIQKKKTETESSEFNNIINEESSESSSIRSNRSSIKSNRNKSDTSKSTKSSESKEKYDKININQSEQKQTSFIPPLQPSLPQQQYTAQINTYPQQPQNQYNQSIKHNEEKVLTPGEVRMKKIEMLRKLSEIKTKGYTLSKEYDFNSSLDEMEYEYDLLKSFADKRNGVKIFKSGLLQVVSLVEFLNDKYDPFDFHLSGWGDHMQVETESWDDVLEEIYEKYRGTGKKVAPEVRLLLLVIASASAFHFTKSQSANLPGLDSLLTSNPGLLSKIINPSKSDKSQFMTPQEINIEKQKAELKKNKQPPQMQSPQMQSPQMQSPQMQSPQIPINQSTRQPQQSSFSAFGNSSPTKNQAPTIRAPDQVKDILSRIHNLQASNIKPNNTETQDETSSNNDRIVSESTMSDSNPNKKKYARKPKKSGISII